MWLVRFNPNTLESNCSVVPVDVFNSISFVESGPLFITLVLMREMSLRESLLGGCCTVFGFSVLTGSRKLL